MATINPYEASLADVEHTSNTPYQPKIIATKGRFRYLAHGVLSYLIVLPIFPIMGLLAIGGVASTGGALSAMEMILGLVAYIFILVYAFILFKRRSNDLEQSGWLSLILLIPLVTIVAGLFLIFAPGKPVTNAYGQPPVKNPVWVVVCTLILLISIVAVAMPGYSSYAEQAQQAERNVSDCCTNRISDRNYLK